MRCLAPTRPVPCRLESPKADFWWPGHNLAGAVELSLIPFVRVRGRLPAIMREQPMDYARYVSLVNAAIAGTTPVVELIRDTSTLRIAGGAATLKLEPQGFAVYYLLAEWAKAVVPGAGPNGIGGNNVGWLTATTIRRPDLARRNPVERLARIGGGKLGARLAPTPANKTQEEENYKVLRDGVSYLREKIAAAIGDQALASRLISEPVGGRSESNPARFGLRLSPDEIVIRAHEGGPEIAPFAHIFPND